MNTEGMQNDKLKFYRCLVAFLILVIIISVIVAWNYKAKLDSANANSAVTCEEQYKAGYKNGYSLGFEYGHDDGVKEMAEKYNLYKTGVELEESLASIREKYVSNDSIQKGG